MDWWPIDAQYSDKIAILLSPPSLPQAQEYFQELVAKRKCKGIKVKFDGEHGRGVYSEVDFQEDDLILKDKMLVGAQDSANKKVIRMVCSFCFRFIGSIERQIGWKLGLESMGIYADGQHRSSGEKTRLSHETIESLIQGRLRLPYSANFALPPVVHCEGGCDEASYCSKSCADADWDSCHSLLCTGNMSPHFNRQWAIQHFMFDASDTNDVFVPAAKVIASTILRYRKLKAARARPVEGKKKKKRPGNWNYGVSNPDDVCDFPLLLEAWKPVSMGFKRRWWDCIALPDDVDSCDEADFRMHIKGLASHLLIDALFDDECEMLFSLDIYGHIIGMLELNKLGLAVESPVEDYFLHIDDLAPSQKEEAEKTTKPIREALGEDDSVSCEGTALYPLQSCVNHSCIPNAKAFNDEEDGERQAMIFALRPIAKGEEITISYIDEDLPYDERQRALARYGFTCKCPRCVEEEVDCTLSLSIGPTR